jgi:hypothetical protein
MDKVLALKVSPIMLQWLADPTRPFTMHKMEPVMSSALFFNPKACYDECCCAMKNKRGKLQCHVLNSFAYSLFVISRDQADAGVDMVVLYSEREDEEKSRS